MNKQDRLTLAKLLQKRRVELGLSAREVARQAGVDTGTVLLLEQGKVAHPRVETLRALSGALDVPLADLYAAVHWLPVESLPSLRPYMRAKYHELTEADLSEIERFVAIVSGRHHQGPELGEDE